MKGKTARKIRQTFTRQKRDAINDWCNFINSQKLKRRIKLAFLVIGGKITFDKLDSI